MNFLSAFTLRVFAGSVAISTGVVHADVLVVAPAGTAHTTIGSAVNAAAEGDIVLVRQNFDPGFQINGKSLTVIADVGFAVEVGYFSIDNLAATQAVTLVGLRTSPYVTGSFPVLQATACAGPIHFVNCAFEGRLVLQTYPPAPPVSLEQCADVVFNGCTITPFENQYDPESGSIGLRLFPNCSVSLFDSTVRGGMGIRGAVGPSGEHDGGAGQSAIESRGSTCFLSGSVITGGAGGAGANGICLTAPDIATAGGRGGAAFAVLSFPGDPISVVRVLDSAIQGGIGGAGGVNPCASASDGALGASYSGVTPSLFGGSRRTLQGAPVAREGQALQLRFRGLPGDRVFLAAGAATSSSFAPSFHGPVVIAQPRRLFVGTVNALGALDLDIAVGELGAGVLGRMRTAQGVFLDLANERWVSGPAALVTLDAGL